MNEDTLTHLNSPPYSIKIDCEGATGLTEVLIDQLYVKKATQAYLRMILPNIISVGVSLGILALVLTVDLLPPNIRRRLASLWITG